MNGFHVQGMAQDERYAMHGTEIGDPIPGEHTFHGDDNVLSERLDDLEENFSICFDISVQPDLPGFIQDAEIHFFGMKVDSAIKFVLFGVKSHLVSSFFIGLWFFGETHNTIS
jgi:hypothetical protein